VQCERAECRKWRRLPLDVDPESLPDLWVCSMNTWDPRFASCAAEEEDVDEVDAEDARRAKAARKLSYRELLFTAEGKLRPPFSERAAITSLFAIGTRVGANGKVHEIEAYEDSEFYDPSGRDYNVHNASTSSSKAKKAPRSSLL